VTSPGVSVAENWRLLDSGLASPARNIALNRALLEAREADESASTLRFARTTRCVLLGHDAVAAEALDLAYCGSERIAVQRRITGGPTCYLDERQLVWDLYLHRRDLPALDLRALAKRICHAAATGLSALGVDARFRSRSDIEVEGRTLASGGCAIDGNGVLFQAALYVDMDPGEAVRPLRMPSGALGEEVRAATCARLTTLKQALGRAPDVRRVKQNLLEAFESEFDVEFREDDLNLAEQARYETALEQIDTVGWADHVSASTPSLHWVQARHETHAGTLRLAAGIDGRAQTIRQLRFLGTPHVTPARTIADLEAALHDIPLDRVLQRIEWFFASRDADLHGLTAPDFVSVVRRAIRQPLPAGKA
jgi:lipoate-protein ligase A